MNKPLQGAPSNKSALPRIEWVDYRCRAEFIRPTAIFAIGDKEVTMSCDVLRRGRHSLHHQVYCITTVTCYQYPLFTNITAARLLVSKKGQMTMKYRWSNEFDPTGLIGKHCWSTQFDPTSGPNSFGQ